MRPNYVARKTAWCAVKPMRVIFFWLIIPLIIMIVDIIAKKKEVIEFYDDKIVTKKGILSRSETTSAFVGVLSVSVNQSLLGRIFDYGNVKVDAVGRWDIATDGIKNPGGLKKYLEGKRADNLTASFAHNPLNYQNH